MDTHWSNTDLQLNFTEHFTSLASRERLPRELPQKRLLLRLYGLGTNSGFKRLAGADPGTTYDLHYVRSNGGKGDKDRIVPFPLAFREPLGMHMQQMKERCATKVCSWRDKSSPPDP